MSMKYIDKDTFEFHGVEITIMYYLEKGIYTAVITHVIQEPDGSLYEPGGGTTTDTDLEHLRYKMTKTYLSNFHDGCSMVFNEKF